ITDPNLSAEDSGLAEAKRSLKDAGRSCKAAKRSPKDELRHPSWQSNPAWGSRLATRTPSAAGTDPRTDSENVGVDRSKHGDTRTGQSGMRGTCLRDCRAK